MHHLHPCQRREAIQAGKIKMRSFANAFLSAVAAMSISGVLFSAVLI